MRPNDSAQGISSVFRNHDAMALLELSGANSARQMRTPHMGDGKVAALWDNQPASVGSPCWLLGNIHLHNLSTRVSRIHTVTRLSWIDTTAAVSITPAHM